MKKKLMALISVTLVVSMLFTACGSKEEAPADEPAVEEGTEEEAPAEEASAALNIMFVVTGSLGGGTEEDMDIIYDGGQI